MSERVVRAKFMIDTTSATANVKGLGATVKQTGEQVDGLGKKAKKTQSDFGGFGQTAGLVGATAAAGLGLAVAQFAKFDKQMSAVQAATHETAGNMVLLREAAIAAGKDTAFSATEAAQGIENLAKAGVSTQAILGGGLKGALDLAAAGQISVAEASETAATAMTQFNLSGAQVPHIADLLAAGAGKAQGEVGDLAAALKQSGLVASQFGISVEETTGTLAAFASAGLIGSDAGTSFKTMLIALANPSKESADKMRELGISAYDAQGAFIGITPLAEQLKLRLSGLSEEARNAALAQIFGNDAIRAANVLYTQGAAGIQDWTTKVNDAGFASETARIKTDNLSGDIERLGGAFDTALIQSGSGANTVLRQIVQTADGAVSAFGDLPPAVTGVATALTAVVAIGGLAAGGTLKAAEAAKDLKTQWTALGRTGKTLTLSMGAVGVALTIAAAVYGAFANKNAEAKQRADDLRGTLDAQTGAITGNTRAYVSNQLAQSGLSEKAKGFGISLSTVTDAALGNKAALDGLVTQLNAIAEANIITNSGVQSGVVRYTEQGESAKKLRDELLKMNGSLTDAQKTQMLASEGAKTNATSQETLAAAQKLAADSAREEAQSLTDLIAQMNKIPGQVLSLRDAQRAFQESLDAATDSIKENGKTLDITTPKGRANQAALDGIAKSANDVTTKMTEQGASFKSVQGVYTSQRASLIATATQFGLSKKAAEEYANKVLAIPKKTNTEIKADITDLEQKLRTAKASLNDPKLTKARRTQIEANIAQLEKAIRNARGQLNSLPDSKTVTLRTIKETVETVIPDRSTGVKKAVGGMIPGSSPSATADNIPVMATAGEYMHQVSAVQKYGTGFMGAVNSGRFPVELAKGYATGGFIGGDPFNLFAGQFAAPGNPLANLHISDLRRSADAAARIAASYRQTAATQQRQLSAAKATQARLDAAYKTGASRLATLRVNGGSDGQIKAQQLKQIALQKQLNDAKAVTKKETGEVTAAEKRYSQAAANSTARNKAYQDGLDKLNDVKKQAIDYAEQVAQTQLQGSKITDFGTADAPTVLAALQERGSRLGAFAGNLEKLQKAGLSKDLLDQLRSAGPSSAQLAQQILAGGSSYIGQLNKADLSLQGQAARIGAGAALQQYSTTYLTTNIQIGNEVVRVVKQVLEANNAALKRAVGQKTGR